MTRRGAPPFIKICIDIEPAVVYIVDLALMDLWSKDKNIFWRKNQPFYLYSQVLKRLDTRIV